FRRWFFFFFQAEDGIRDFHVTGVQTCALPIWFHRTYCELGVDVIETNTFGAFAVPLNEYGIGHRDREISRANAEIARRVADEFEIGRASCRERGWGAEGGGAGNERAGAEMRRE